MVGGCAALTVQRASAASGPLDTVLAEAKKATQMPAPKSQEADIKFNTEDFAIFSGRANPAVSRRERDERWRKLATSPSAAPNAAHPRDFLLCFLCANSRSPFVLAPSSWPKRSPTSWA